MLINTEGKNHLIESINNSYNFISDVFIIDNSKYIVLVNLLTYDFKIIKIHNNFDLFFLNKYKILNKSTILSIINKKFTFKNNTRLSNPILFNYKINSNSLFSNNITYKLEIKDNKINKIRASYSSYDTTISLEELSSTSIYMKHFFKFHIIEHFNLQVDEAYYKLRNLSLYLVNLIEHMEVFIKLLYYIDEKAYLKEFLNIYNKLLLLLEDLNSNNLNEINKLLTDFLNTNKLLKFIKKTKNNLNKSILISKEEAFYNSISGTIARASGLDIDFNKVKKTVLGTCGSTYERFYIRYYDILRLINEIISIKEVNFKLNIKNISKLHNKIISFENSNGLVFSILDYDEQKDSLKLKLHFSSINNINLFKYAINTKTPCFDYFLISLNIKHEELALNKIFNIEEASKKIKKII